MIYIVKPNADQPKDTESRPKAPDVKPGSKLDAKYDLKTLHIVEAAAGNKISP